MLSKEDIKEFISFGFPCLRRENPLFSILREIEKKKPKPTEKELNIIKNGLETGNVRDSILKKFWPSAYEGVKKYGVRKYFLVPHNKTRMYLPEPIGDWCLFRPGDITGKTDSEYIVKIIDGKEIKSVSIYHPDYPNLKIINENDIKIGSHVAIHRNQIVKVLDENEYITFSNFYNQSRPDS